MKAVLLYFRLIAWMFGQMALGLIALFLIPFTARRTTISAGTFYHDD